MEQKNYKDATNDSLDDLTVKTFAGRVVRKDLTKMIKESANVPVFVLEYLLGSYCTGSDPKEIEDGITRVKSILAEHYVRPDEAEKIKSKIKEEGTYKIIDKINVKLDEKKDIYVAEFVNIGLKNIRIPGKIVTENEKLLVGGIWAIATLNYLFDEDEKKSSPFSVMSLKPIQVPNVDINEVFEGRKQFNETQWIDLIMRSCGLEPSQIEERTKWHILARLVPLVENKVNLIELGPRSTGKSHIYKELSPNSILVSGGQTSVANLFYNLSTRKVGLVGLWDCVAFDEVAGMKFKDSDGVQIMKDYMASGSFVRGRDSIEANASMIFLGNIDQSVESMIKTSHLLAPLPVDMIDSAFIDRFHCYIPGWEVPKFNPQHFTNRYGFIVDYFAEFVRELRKYNYSDAIDKYFQFGKDINQRDSIAIRRFTSGLLKLIYPNKEGHFTKTEVESCLRYSLEVRRRIKEQLKKIGGMEFYNVHFSYIDLETNEEKFVTVPEQSSGKLIPEGQLPAGNLHTIGKNSDGQIGLFRLEMQKIDGNGKFNVSGMGSQASAKESARIGFDYFKANIKQITSTLATGNFDYHMHVVDLHNTGSCNEWSLAAFISLSSALLGKPLQQQIVVLGHMTLGGALSPIDNLADCLQMAHDSGAKKALLPISSASNVQSVPPELLGKFQLNFYQTPADAVFKALGVE